VHSEFFFFFFCFGNEDKTLSISKNLALKAKSVLIQISHSLIRRITFFFTSTYFFVFSINTVFFKCQFWFFTTRICSSRFVSKNNNVQWRPLIWKHQDFSIVNCLSLWQCYWHINFGCDSWMRSTMTWVTWLHDITLTLSNIRNIQ
jgi:hypothetical protein